MARGAVTSRQVVRGGDQVCRTSRITPRLFEPLLRPHVDGFQDRVMLGRPQSELHQLRLVLGLPGVGVHKLGLCLHRIALRNTWVRSFLGFLMTSRAGPSSTITPSSMNSSRSPTSRANPIS